MRFIGSKVNLLDHIEQFINDEVQPENSRLTFCDIFAGTGSVAKRFKKKYKIITNDSLYLSYVLQKAFIENNCVPTFSDLKMNGAQNTLDYLNEAPIPKDFFAADSAFIRDNYSPYGPSNRMYLTVENAERVDFIRIIIERWYETGKINEKEYFYLIALLIEAIPFVSNITGTYGAYLKKWDARAHKKINLKIIEVIENGGDNESYNEDSNELIKKIEGDILYIDPPYNQRQYEPNYHLLETVAAYDSPKIYGVTGMRPYLHKKSDYCIKSKAINALDSLVKDAKFKHIVMSYSSDGIMSEKEIENSLKLHGVAQSFKLKKIPYRKYKSKIYEHSDLHEYLFYVRKEPS